MKKFLSSYLCGFVSALLILGFSLPILADTGVLQQIYVSFDPIRILIDGKDHYAPLDMQPMIYNGRTYVALRFIGDAFGKTVDWQDGTKTITINSSGSTNNNTPVNNIPTTSANPNVLSAIPSKTSISPGESVSITITANKDTKGIKLMDDRLNILGDSTVYADMGDTRVFTMNYTPASGVSGLQRVIAYPTDGVVMNTINYAKEFTLTIIEDRKINSIEAAKSSASLNTTVKISVYTNDAVTKVKLANDYDNVIEENSNYSTSGSQRIFTFSVSSNRSRTTRYTAYPGSNSGYDDSIYKTVSITWGSTSSSNSSDITVSTSNSGSSKKKISVVTYDDIELVEIQNSSGRVLDTIKSSSNYSSSKVEWTTTINNSSLSGSGATYYAYAYYDFDDNDYIRKSFTMSSSSGGSGLIYDHDVSDDRPDYGEKVTVTFYTDYELTTVQIRDPDDQIVTYATRPKESSGGGEWTAVIRPTLSGNYTIYVKDSDGYDDEVSFYLGVNE